MGKNRLKVAVVFGTRPEAVKLAPVIRKLEADCSRFEVFNLSTGQHLELLDQVLELFQIDLHANLRVMRPDSPLSNLSARILDGLDALYKEIEPDLCIVQGDTTTACFGAISAFYNHIPIAHVEAGLRTGDMQNPFPEELNRVLVSKLASFHFAPTDRNEKALIDEGIPVDQIHVVGNTVIDALRITVNDLRGSLKKREKVYEGLHEKGLNFVSEGWFQESGLNLVLVTAHRRENIGDPVRQLTRAILSLAERYPEKKFVFPLHKNPRVLKSLELGNILPDNLFITEHLNYHELVMVLLKSCKVLTDSGGIQEEACALGIPTLVARKVSERIEKSMTNTIVLQNLADKSEIESKFDSLKEKIEFTEFQNCPFGDGFAAEKLVDILSSNLLQSE